MSSETMACHAWSPGLESTIPSALLPQVTLYRPENSLTDYAEAQELAAFSGLNPVELVLFKPERLIVHELLIRVTADLSVPDGPSYAELGINLRSMVDTILRKYAFPELDRIKAVHERVSADAATWMDHELAALFEPTATEPPPVRKRSLLVQIFLGRPGKNLAPAPPRAEQPEVAALDNWAERRHREADPFERACLSAIIRVVGAILTKRGSLIGDKKLIGNLATRLVCNSYGSEQVGNAIEPLVEQAAVAEGYRVLPTQKKPVIMNVKGASAAGKSTIRPDQMRLSKKLGIPWEDFAVISPDYWRKYLLDYDSLGEHAKYAAMMTGQELELVDKKLDRYMAEKAAQRNISHLLIDRFRFDSFVLEENRAADSKLLTRFGELVFMFFMITAPGETVKRAWIRGLRTGRFKAVDDLLFHNVEAYTGMPELFFSWALSKDKRIHYEFLDNNVPEGELPRTIAFGWNGKMTILDIKVMLDIDRYRKVNVDAKGPEEIFADPAMDPAQNTAFLKRCTDLIPTIQFADGQTGYVYGAMEAGKWVWRDTSYTKQISTHIDWTEGLRAIGWFDGEEAERKDFEEPNLEGEKVYTLGLWGPGS